ncbi:TPA: hypothetical protein U1X82_002273 [Streptococcus suis]|nr:hypothetical protein [Streptococcus suis]HEM4277470.1 hypothetical protein [Streptococcus suis]
MQEKKRKGYATQAQQNEANKRYYHASEENRQRRLYTSAKSTAKNFVRTKATKEDLEELEDLILEEKKKF